MPNLQDTFNWDAVIQELKDLQAKGAIITRHETEPRQAVQEVHTLTGGSKLIKVGPPEVSIRLDIILPTPNEEPEQDTSSALCDTETPVRGKGRSTASKEVFGAATSK